MAGLYVHIPFCASKCAYCDFPSYPIKSFSSETMDMYIGALLREAEKFRDASFETVYIGGGTPSVLGADLMGSLLDGLGKLKIGRDAEWTMELNPGASDINALACAKFGGVNRISIGVQAAQDALLQRIGRAHTVRQSVEIYTLARDSGFNNINLDIMYGLPEQTASDFEETLKFVLDLDPEHISAYSLILEEGTRLYDTPSLTLPCDCEIAEMENMLVAIPFERYEISNYAKPGRRCLHNINYWLCGEYIGIGAGAHSHMGHVRWENTRGVEEYITSDCPVRNREYVCAKDAEFESVMMGLRMVEGISVRRFLQKHGRSAEEAFPNWKWLCEQGLVSEKGGSYRLTERGFDVMNSVLTLLMGD